jgi:hypothetical protein
MRICLKEWSTVLISAAAIFALLWGYDQVKVYAQQKRQKPTCMVEGELLVIDGLMEGFKNAERNGDEPSWKGIQERLREARRLILSQEGQ